MILRHDSGMFTHFFKYLWMVLLPWSSWDSLTVHQSIQGWSHYVMSSSLDTLMHWLSWNSLKTWLSYLPHLQEYPWMEKLYWPSHCHIMYTPPVEVCQDINVTIDKHTVYIATNQNISDWKGCTLTIVINHNGHISCRQA